MKRLFSLFFFLKLFSFNCFSQYTYVYFQNNTDLALSCTPMQTGGSLSTSNWYGYQGNINSWEKTKQLMWFSRDGGITNGVDFYFDLKLKYISDSIILKVKLNGNLVGSDMWLSSQGPGYSHPWYFDNNFHEQTFSFGGKSCTLKYESYFTGGYDDLRYVLQWNNPYPVDSVSLNNENTFQALAYNIFILTPPISTSDQKERAIEMKHHVKGYDAIIISEAFYNTVRVDDLIPGLSIEYPYHTAVVDQSGAIEDGGVMIFSRHPIETESQINFIDCDGTDCFSAKGVMYARINKMGKRYHIFGTHTQAWPEQTPVEIRQGQLAEIRNFIVSRNIPSNEPVLVGGDLNVDKINNNFNEYFRMFDTLNSVPPIYSGYPFTYDMDANNYASSGKEYLDYVLPVKDYFFPIVSENEVRIFRTITDDLFYQNDMSDHFAVKGKMEYPYIINQSNVENVCYGEDAIIFVNHSHSMYHTWIHTPNDSSITTNNDTLVINNLEWSDSGEYVCKLSYSNGFLMSDTIKVKVHSLPNLVINQPDTFCFGNSLDLATIFTDSNNVQGNVTYWRDSNCVLVAPQVVIQSGIYYIKKQSIYGCIDVESVQVVFVSPPNIPVIINNNNVLSVSIASGDSVQWYFNGIEISNAVDTFYVPLQSGFYSVTITRNGCTSVSSSAINIVVTEVKETFFDSELMIFPNPVHDNLFLEGVDAELIVVDVLGNQLLGIKENQTQIDISFLAKGVYYLQSKNVKNRTIKSFVKI